jgi:hypothetical protein
MIPAATTSPASTRRKCATTPSASSKRWVTTSPWIRRPDRAAHPLEAASRESSRQVGKPVPAHQPQRRVTE